MSKFIKQVFTATPWMLSTAGGLCGLFREYEVATYAFAFALVLWTIEDRTTR